MTDDLEERLRAHGRAFEGLLSLIPAKYYYEQDNNDQWQKKKQTKEERYQARKAKLDPDNIKSAKDVMDERALKRKRDLRGDDEESSEDVNMDGKERPREGLKDTIQAKKRKTNESEVTHDAEPGANNTTEVQQADDQLTTKSEKRKEKRERKKEKAAKQKTKDKEKQKRRKAAHKAAPEVTAESKQESGVEDQSAEAAIPEVVESATFEPEQNTSAAEHITSRASPFSSHSPVAESTFSDAQPASSKSSPPPLDGEPPHTKLDATPLPDRSTATNGIATPPAKPNHDALKARLQARIDALRAARKADGPDGTPARSRAELIEARRFKQEAKRAHRLEQQARQRAAEAAAAAGRDGSVESGAEAGAMPETPLSREEQQRVRAEMQLARLRGTESPLFAPAETARVGAAGLLFGRVGFGGASPDTDSADDDANQDAGGGGAGVDKAVLRDAFGVPAHPPRKRKGPVDAKSALRAATARAARLEGMSDAQREAAQRRTAWAAAAARVRGEKAMHHLDDADPALLRKTVKRRERAKARGEKEWKAREEGVRRAGEMKQKKREENLAKRREEKGGKAKGKGGKKPDPKAKRRKAKERAFGSLK